MRRYLAIVIGLALALGIAACTDTPSAGKSPYAGSGEGGLSRAQEEAAYLEEGAALPPPEVEKGVVPDVLGVRLGDAEEAIKEAGFKTSVEGGGLFKIVSAKMLICEQDPEGDSSPKKGSKVELLAERSCE